MLLFFEVQALAALVLTVPFAIAALNPTPTFAPLEWVGAAVWAIGLIGEATADRQLARFRTNPANKGQVCQDGLWRYSRHPNYFFEWVIWCGFGLFALGSPGGWLGLHVVPLMFYVMRYGTGVPYAEASSLRSRGDRTAPTSRRPTSSSPDHEALGPALRRRRAFAAPPTCRVGSTCPDSPLSPDFRLPTPDSRCCHVDRSSTATSCPTPSSAPASGAISPCG